MPTRVVQQQSPMGSDAIQELLEIGQSLITAKDLDTLLHRIVARAASVLALT